MLELQSLESVKKTLGQTLYMPKFELLKKNRNTLEGGQILLPANNEYTLHIGRYQDCCEDHLQGMS